MRRFITLAALLIAATPAAAQVKRRTVLSGDLVDCPAIQRAIDALPAAGGEVALAARTFTCNAPIVIARNDVTLRGSGPATLLRLADAANAPVIVIGGTEAVPATTYRRIAVMDLAIDGNRRNQSFECFRGDCTETNALRNNGVSVRRVEDVLVQNVRVTGARSGGLVTELGVRRATVRDFTAADNSFDGLAGYQTEDSVFDGLYLHDNLEAGISLDIQFNNNLIANAVIERTGKVGVFMRDARDNVFSGMQIRNSGEHGIFIAQVEGRPATAATGNSFVSLVVAKSAGAGVRVNDISCVNNLLASSQLIENRDGGVGEVVPGLLQRSGVVIR